MVGIPEKRILTATTTAATPTARAFGASEIRFGCTQSFTTGMESIRWPIPSGGISIVGIRVGALRASSYLSVVTTIGIDGFTIPTVSVTLPFDGTTRWAETTHAPIAVPGNYNLFVSTGGLGEIPLGGDWPIGVTVVVELG